MRVAPCSLLRWGLIVPVIVMEDDKMIQLTYFSGVPRQSCNPITNRVQAETLAKWEDSVGEVFGGFTKYQGIEYWQGHTEDSVTYVIVFSEVAVRNWEFCAKQFKLKLAETLAQNEVLVTWHQLGGIL